MTSSAQHPPLSHPKYRPDIDGLRAVAVLSVLGFHAFPAVFPAGFIGVDIFFVISGYLISSIIFENLDHGSFSFGQFYGRRIKRIFPALTAVLLSCLVFGWFALLADEFKQLGKHMAAGAAFVSNFALWQEAGYFNNAGETKPLLHLWSLAIEEQFYIVWPLLVWLTWKPQSKNNVLFLLMCIGLFIASFALNAHQVRIDPTVTFYSPATRVWELLAGVLLAYLRLRPLRWQATARQLNVASTLGLLLLAFGLYKIDKFRPFPGTWALLPVLGAFCLIFAGPAAWFNRFVLSNRLMVWVGLISFPLYLWHWPLLTFARIVESQTPAPFFRLGALALSVLLAWLTYRLIEKPIRTGDQSRLKITVLSALMAVLGIFGYLSFQNKGFPERTAAQVATVNSWENDTFAGTCNSLTRGPNQDDWCNTGNAPTQSPTHILIGDSIGNAYAPMLQAYARQDGAQPFIFRQYGRGACPNLLGIGPEHCQELTNAAAALIKQTPSVHTVILASNWPLYYNGYEWTVNNHIDNAQFKTAFEKTVAHYQNLGKRVLVFLAPPVGANPRACVVRPWRLTRENNCNLARTEAVNNDGDYRGYFATYLKNNNIATFDPFTYLCDSQQCKTTDGTHILYLDHEHFSLLGGQFLAQQADKDLQKLLSPTAK